MLQAEQHPRADDAQCGSQLEPGVLQGWGGVAQASVGAVAAARCYRIWQPGSAAQLAAQPAQLLPSKSRIACPLLTLTSFRRRARHPSRRFHQTNCRRCSRRRSHQDSCWEEGWACPAAAPLAGAPPSSSSSARCDFSQTCLVEGREGGRWGAGGLAAAKRGERAGGEGAQPRWRRHLAAGPAARLFGVLEAGELPLVRLVDVGVEDGADEQVVHKELRQCGVAHVEGQAGELGGSGGPEGALCVAARTGGAAGSSARQPLAQEQQQKARKCAPRLPFPMPPSFLHRALTDMACCGCWPTSLAPAACSMASAHPAPVIVTNREVTAFHMLQYSQRRGGRSRCT